MHKNKQIGNGDDGSRPPLQQYRNLLFSVFFVGNARRVL